MAFMHARMHIRVDLRDEGTEMATEIHLLPSGKSLGRAEYGDEKFSKLETFGIR